MIYANDFTNRECLKFIKNALLFFLLKYFRKNLQTCEFQLFLSCLGLVQNRYRFMLKLSLSLYLGSDNGKTCVTINSMTYP